MNDIAKLADILDEDIEKGLSIERRQRPTSKIRNFEEDIAKSLSFNPWTPVDMVDDSPYYNPYLKHPDGGYYPHHNDQWTATGRANDAGTDSFYRVAGDEPMDARPVVAEQSRSQFAKFSKSFMDFVHKGGPVPVGTVHTHSDGQAYKKVAEGKWVPTVGIESKKTQKYLEHKDPKVRAQASHGIEQEAAKKQKIEEMIKQRAREEQIIGRAKDEAVQAAAGHLKNVTGKMFDGKPPKEFDKMHQEHIESHGFKKQDPKSLLEAGAKTLQPKVHHVQVGFTHQGKQYSHRFENVHGGTHQEAIERVQEILKQKLPGHQLTSVRAETPKENMAAKPGAKPAPKKPSPQAGGIK